MKSTRISLGLALPLSVLLACRSSPIACPLATLPQQPPPVPVRCGPAGGYPFTNLVFEGGGVKGLAYAGALQVLDDGGILPRGERVAGTSAGSITAMLVALRYTPAEIHDLLFALPFKQFEDGGATGLFRVFRRFGWFEGDNYLELMRCLVGLKTGNRNATFRDLKAKGFLDLHMFATDLNTGRSLEFSFATTPDEEVALAARTSGSFPLFFAAIERAGDVLVDGGVVDNYPIDAFDTAAGLDRGTLGFVLLATDQAPTRRAVRDLPQYAKSLFATSIESQVDALETDLPNLTRTAVLNDLGVSTLDFELTNAQKRGLIEEGARCTCAFLEGWAAAQGDGASLAGRVPLRRTGRCGWVLPPGS